MELIISRSPLFNKLAHLKRLRKRKTNDLSEANKYYVMMRAYILSSRLIAL